ncbi:hypothetical protein ES695_07300 [Candidatus Atribacteria bacterium 1244-E10-H5-B2]|nr:MAG: hypothetical protein ES695_07300 [Candidatus Atribacteria bacterium 1244-E10-H5-B2]
MKYKETIPVVNEIISQYDIKLTVRQIYYRLISDPYVLFENTKSRYTQFDKMLVVARERREVDYTKIEDRTREALGGDSDYGSPQEFLRSEIDYLKNCWQDYKKEIWANQDYKLEIWVEKDALANLIFQVAKDFRVLVFPSKGYSSFTKVMECLERLEGYSDKERVVLHLTDHDPSGLDMTRDLGNRLSSYGGDSIQIKKIGLTYEQIERFSLRPNPVKKSDTKASYYMSQFGSDCWELDALPPLELQNLVVESIKEYIDLDAWNEKIGEEKDCKNWLVEKIKEIGEKI